MPVLLLATSAVACGGEEDSSGGADPTAGLPEVAESEFEDLTGEAQITIDAKDNVFEPEYVTVSPGTEITFENRGRNPHNVVPAAKEQFETIPADQLQPDDTATIVFDEPGIYPYYCSLHGTASAGMVGRIRVAEG
jgi:plastocyanin